MRALIIVDMLNDFVDGKLANPKAQAIIGPLQRLLARARDEGWVVVFSNDAHQPDDPELRVWGEHAMAGTREAEVIAQLAPREGEIVSPENTTTQPSSRACASSRWSGPMIACAFGLASLPSTKSLSMSTTISARITTSRLSPHSQKPDRRER